MGRRAAQARRQQRLPRSGEAHWEYWSVRLGRQALRNAARASTAVSPGVQQTRTPAFSRASFLAWAVPAEPEMMAPAWPIVLPSGAVKPATYPTTGLVTCSAM